MTRNDKQYETIYFQRGSKIVGLAVDIDAEQLFWSDTGPMHRAIFTSRLDGSDVNMIVSGVEECNGLSVDWVSKHIYWTDAAKATLEVANYDGSGRRILIGDGLVNPRGIVVDPVFGFVFWADQGTKRIERSCLDGNERKVVVDKDLAWPNQMAVSYPTRRLYWVDAKKQTIMSCDVDGGDITKERDLVETSMGNPVFGLVVIGNNAIVSVWFNTKISSTYVATRETFWRDEMLIPKSTELYSLVSTAPSMQPGSFHPCGQPEKGGCTHLCLPTRGISYKCACPSFGGLALSFNAKSCEAPSELLFFTLKESGEVGFISLRGAQSPYLTLAGRSKQPSAVTYDPIKQVVYWSDTEERVIYQSSLAGTGEKEVFLDGSNGVGLVDGLALDWISRQLYFTNMGQSTPGLDGAVYSWHRLEKISLQRTQRKTVVSAVERPRGIALDLDNGFLFYGDWSKQPQIVQSFLDGSSPKVILNHNLSNPNGLSFYEGRLYIADSNFNNKTPSPHLMVFDAATGEWTPLKLSHNVSLPMGLAVQGDTLYYSDWISTESSKGYIKSFNLRFGVDNSVILSGKKPTGLHYSPLARRKQEPRGVVCEKSLCSDDCVRMPTNKERPLKCLCPDESPKMLSSNSTSCQRPQNFLLVADLNTLKMISLDDDTETGAHTLFYSSVESNFVALAYDNTTDMIYWSDITKKSIYSSSLMNFKPHVMYSADYYIDGLVVDTEKQRLFWTGYIQNGSGVIARLNIHKGDDSYHEILHELNNPRAIHLYPDKKLLFWTEYGGGKNAPARVNKAKISGLHRKVLMSHGLFWPNALATHYERLYVADGAGKVFMMDLNGGQQTELSFLTGSVSHIFGLVIMDTVLFYSDWFTNSIYMVDRINGQTEAFATHLSRPTSIVAYHPTNLTANNQCMKSGHNCEETCVPVPRAYHCSCSIGSKLAPDKRGCIQLENPWEITEELRCHKPCHADGYCSQLVPLLKYQCVCKAGYEGDGITTCSECGEDFYKPLLGNDTCYPCPMMSSTQGVTTSTQCICNNPQYKVVDGVCTDTSITTPESVTTETEPHEVEFENTTTIKSTWPIIDEDATDFPTTDDVSSGTVGQPYFENCPQGEIMVMKLPETSSKIWLPVNWTARDAYGNELPVRSNFNKMDNKILIPWVANGNVGQQKVVFEAEDNWHQIAVCEFHVLLEDFVPPKFVTCPLNIIKKTSMNYEPISWLPPQATDNVHEPKVVSSHEPKSEFGIGTNEVIYTATDGAGNKAKCTFNVTLIYEQPCQIPEIANGRFRCEDSEINICHIECYEGHILNPLGMFPRTVSCMLDSDLSDLMKVMKRQQPCLKQRRPMTAHKNFILEFVGPCLPDDIGLKTLLREKVIVKLEEKLLCDGASCTHSSVSLICAPEVKKRRNVEDKFNMTWNVTIKYVPPQNAIYDGFSPGQVMKIVTVMTYELKKLASHIDFLYNQQNYRTKAGSINTMDFQWLCLPGEMKIMDGCVPCPAGSYLNKTLEKCVLCGEGYYQNTSGQANCLMCMEGVTLEDGALNVTECLVFPAINEMSKFLIITVCSFGLVFLCMVIFMYLQYQHQHKKSKNEKKDTSISKFMPPNIYAQTPAPNQMCPDYIRASRDFFMSAHDYEDIDGQHKSTFETFSRRLPGCRDSLSSFKAQTDMTFLQSPSPNGTSSIRTSDETLMPNSPRGSAKSFTMYGDGGYPYSTSPNGTMGSFKGSPPVSPYKSLHLSANGPPDSPSRNSQMLSSLLSEESPYTSRLIRDRLIDPGSPYRIISQDRRNGSESPYRMNRRMESENYLIHDPSMNQENPYRAVIKESPYRSPALQTVNKAMSETGMRSPSYALTADTHSLARSVPENTIVGHPINLPREDGGVFVPAGDFLYKRPPSPLFTPMSSKKSSDSLQRSPSTPRTSPGMSRRRLENSYKTPPMNQKRKTKTEFGLYEYE
ncbi:hypothetical protein BsWGS_16075 [Bradybaena similaris]